MQQDTKQDYSDTKKLMRLIGFPLLIIGIFLLVYGMINFGSNFGSSSDSNTDQWDFNTRHEEFERAAQQSWNNFLTFGAGMFLTFFGFVLVGASATRPVSKYYATEMSPAIEITGKAIGEGLKESGVLSQSNQKEIIKIKCPNCGYLESEDAEFCSKCGKRI